MCTMGFLIILVTCTCGAGYFYFYFKFILQLFGESVQTLIPFLSFPTHTVNERANQGRPRQAMEGITSHDKQGEQGKCGKEDQANPGQAENGNRRDLRKAMGQIWGFC